MRKTSNELKEIMLKNNTEKIWSWSKINCFMTSPYEYFLKYILHENFDRNDCIYGVIGGLCHSILEKLYQGEIAYEDMSDLFEDAWLTGEVLGLKFDRNDVDKNRNISAKYYKNLKHFFNNHQKIKGKTVIEQFITIKIYNHLFQGYIDCIFKDKNGIYHIVDFKTSSIYKNEKIEKESGQLVLYAIGLLQKGIPIDKIKICWNFLKYVKAECEQTNGKISVREINRHEIGNTLKSSVTMWLKRFKYNPDNYIKELILTNDLKCLPSEVRAKFKIRDCLVYIPLTRELVTNLGHKISKIIDEIEQRETEYFINNNENIFYDSMEDIQKQNYYFATLCGYSAKLHKPYKAYLESLKNKNNTNFKPIETENTKEDSDLSWLENI